MDSPELRVSPSEGTPESPAAHSPSDFLSRPPPSPGLPRTSVSCPKSNIAAQTPCGDCRCEAWKPTTHTDPGQKHHSDPPHRSPTPGPLKPKLSRGQRRGDWLELHNIWVQAAGSPSSFTIISLSPQDPVQLGCFIPWERCELNRAYIYACVSVYVACPCRSFQRNNSYQLDSAAVRLYNIPARTSLFTFLSTSYRTTQSLLTECLPQEWRGHCTKKCN